MKIRFFTLIFLLCFALSACGSENHSVGENVLGDGQENVSSGNQDSEEAQVPGEAKTLGDFFPPFAALHHISVYDGTTSAQFPDPKIIVRASQDEQAKLLECLNVPLDGFYVAEEGVEVSTTAEHTVITVFWIETDQGDYKLTVTSGDLAQTVQFNQVLSLADFSMEALENMINVTIVGPADTLPNETLLRLSSEIRENTTDAEHTGTVTYADGDPQTISKARTAAARSVLDGTLALASSAEGEEMLPATFESGGYLYHLDPETGRFSREGDGALQYGQVEEDWRSYVNLQLGLPLFLAEGPSEG